MLSNADKIYGEPYFWCEMFEFKTFLSQTGNSLRSCLQVAAHSKVPAFVPYGTAIRFALACKWRHIQKSLLLFLMDRQFASLLPAWLLTFVFYFYFLFFYFFVFLLSLLFSLHMLCFNQTFAGSARTRKLLKKFDQNFNKLRLCPTFYHYKQRGYSMRSVPFLRVYSSMFFFFSLT